MPKRTRKVPNTAASRALDAEWERLLATHAKPLERGAKAKGVTTKFSPAVVLSPAGGVRDTSTSFSIQSVPMTGAATLPRVNEDMQQARTSLAARVGLSYNKGGLQYLSDDELKEQRTGSHKRR